MAKTTETPEVKEITLADLAAAIKAFTEKVDAILKVINVTPVENAEPDHKHLITLVSAQTQQPIGTVKAKELPAIGTFLYADAQNIYLIQGSSMQLLQDEDNPEEITLDHKEVRMTVTNIASKIISVR